MKLLTNDPANVRIFDDNSIHNASIDTSLNFVRLSDDGQAAFFRLDQHHARGEDWIFEAIGRRSPEEINDAKQMVQIRNRIHDIYIPDLNVDKERKEISFNWIKVFSLFFAERYSVDLFQEQWVRWPFLFHFNLSELHLESDYGTAVDARIGRERRRDSTHLDAPRPIPKGPETS